LTSEIHSFGRILSGCFYDTIRNIFNGAPGAKNEAALLKAAKTAGKLLVKGAAQAPLAVRFFQSVGRAMVLADAAANGGANRVAIGQAFAGHGVQLGSSSVLLPKAGLAGKPPTSGKTVARVSAATLKDIRQRIGAASGSKFSSAPITLGAVQAVEVLHHRAVPLGKLSTKLKGVVAMSAEALVVGRSGHAAAALSAMPDLTTTTDEVTTFVQTLLKHGRIDFDGLRTTRPRSSLALGAKRAVAKAKPAKLTSPATHRVVMQAGQKTLVRTRFTCGR